MALDFRCPRCLFDKRDRDGLSVHMSRQHQCLIGSQSESMECIHCDWHTVMKNRENWENHLLSQRHRASIGMKVVDQFLTDYIKSDSKFLQNHDVETMLEIFGDLNDPRGVVYRMFRKLHITTNRNIALLNEDSTFVLVVQQRAWAVEEPSFLWGALSVCAHMVKAYFNMTRSLRFRFRGGETLARLDEYTDTLRDELLSGVLSQSSLELVKMVRKRLVEETLKC